MGKKDKNGKEEEESGQGERKVRPPAHGLAVATTVQQLTLCGPACGPFRIQESYPAVDTFFYRNVEDCSVIARPLLPEWRDEDVGPLPVGISAPGRRPPALPRGCGSK